MKVIIYFITLLILFSPFINGVAILNDGIPLIRPDDIDFNPNITINVTADTADKWDTDDHGPLSAASELLHNWLGSIQGGATGEYFHLNESIYNYTIANIFNFINASYVSNALANIHDQDLNTTDRVVFQTVNLTCGPHFNQSCLNISGDATIRDLYARDVYVSNNTLYIGDNIKLSSNGAVGSTLNISGGNVTVGDDGYYFGSGKYLEDINASQINFSGDSIEANGFTGNYFNGGNFTGDNFTGLNFFGGNYYGIFNWLTEGPFLNFNGTLLTFNDTLLNNTIELLDTDTQKNASGPYLYNDSTTIYLNETYLINQTEVRQIEEVKNISVVGGTGSATTDNVIDFEIKQITVECSSGTVFRFEAIEATSGDIIDKDRKQHNTLWDIEKNYIINDKINLSITNTNPTTDTCNVTIKYLTQLI